MSWQPKLTDTQRRVFESNARFTLLDTSRRRGMSFLALHCEVKRQHPRTKKWENCPNPVALRIQFKGKRTALCERCCANVQSGAYGSDWSFLPHELPMSTPAHENHHQQG